MRTDKKQLVRLAIIAGVFGAVMLTGVTGRAVRGSNSWVPIVAAVVALAIVIGGFWISRLYVQRMLMDPTPDRIIAHYHASVRRIPNAPAVAAYLSALAAAVFGQFDRARAELDAIEWSDQPSMYQGQRLHVLALITLLEKNDPEEALRMANDALTMERKGGGMQILHDAIRIAAGQSGAEAVARAEAATRRRAGVMPAICQWALTKHYERDGNAAEAERRRAALRKAFPGFSALLS